eukprot:2435842-Pleurochrysis_carterae.AAC.1
MRRRFGARFPQLDWRSHAVAPCSSVETCTSGIHIACPVAAAWWLLAFRCAQPRCKALSSTTPRAGRRRTLPLAEE